MVTKFQSPNETLFPDNGTFQPGLPGKSLELGILVNRPRPPLLMSSQKTRLGTSPLDAAESTHLEGAFFCVKFKWDIRNLAIRFF